MKSRGDIQWNETLFWTQLEEYKYNFQIFFVRCLTLFSVPPTERAQSAYYSDEKYFFFKKNKARRRGLFLEFCTIFLLVFLKRRRVDTKTHIIFFFLIFEKNETRVNNFHSQENWKKNEKDHHTVSLNVFWYHYKTSYTFTIFTNFPLFSVGMYDFCDIISKQLSLKVCYLILRAVWCACV